VLLRNVGYYYGNEQLLFREDEERRKQKKTIEPKKDESDSTFSEENKDTKGKNPKRNPEEDI
jgi:hypothetical protein